MKNKHFFSSSFLKSTFLLLLISLFCWSLAAQSEDVFKVKNVIRGFKKELGSRASKLYDSQYIMKQEGLTGQLHTWYQIPREEYILAAYDDIYGLNVFSDSFAEGAVFTDKGLYVRKVSVWSVSYRDLQYMQTSYDDSNFIVENPRAKKRATMPVRDSEITPFEMKMLVDDIAYSINKNKASRPTTSRKPPPQTTTTKGTSRSTTTKPKSSSTPQPPKKKISEAQKRKVAEAKRKRAAELKQKKAIAAREAKKRKEREAAAAAKKAKVRAQNQIEQEIREAAQAVNQKNYNKAFQILSRHQHSPYFTGQAQYLLGYLYQYGKGIKKNKKLAKEWYRKANSSGYQLPAYAKKLL